MMWFGNGFQTKFIGRPDSLVYGVAWDTSQPSPLLRRIDENGDNLYIGAAEFDAHPTWGGRRRCQVIPQVNTNDPADIIYGTNPRGDGLDYLSGQYIMVEQPICSVATWMDGNYKCMCIGDKPFTGTPLGNSNPVTSSIHPTFYQRGHVGNPAPFYYAGAYPSSGTTGVGMYSRRGYTPMGNTTSADFEQVYANPIGRGWGITNIWYQWLRQMMMYIEFASLDIQTAFTPGITTGTTPTVTGNADAYLLPNGSFPGGTNTQSATWRGESDIYGNVWDTIVGLNAGATDYLILHPSGQGSSDGRVNPILQPGEYAAWGAVPLQNGTTGVHGYATQLDPILFSNYALLPSATSGGTATTYLSDFFYTLNTSAIPPVVYVGGEQSMGTQCGPGYYNINNPLTFAGNVQTAARLEYIPPASVDIEP